MKNLRNHWGWLLAALVVAFLIGFYKSADKDWKQFVKSALWSVFLVGLVLAILALSELGIIPALLFAVVAILAGNLVTGWFWKGDGTTGTGLPGDSSGGIYHVLPRQSFTTSGDVSAQQVDPNTGLPVQGQ